MAKNIAVVQMSLEKSTKSTYRFKADDEDAPVTTLYVSQDAFTSEPSSITVTVEV